MKHNLFKRVLSVVLAAVCIIGTAVVNTVSYNAAVIEASNAEPTKNEYQILSPVPSGSSISPIEQPARLDTLKGKRIALVGGSFSASVTHQVLSDMLEEEFGCITFYMTDEIGKSGTFNPNSISDKSKAFQQKLKEYNIRPVLKP